MPVVLRDSLGFDAADTPGAEASLPTGCGSATPAALPRCTTNASDVAAASDGGAGIASGLGPTGADKVVDALSGAIAAPGDASADLAIAFHCAKTASIQWTSVQALRDCRHWDSWPGESFPALRRDCCRATISSYSLFRIAWSQMTRSAGCRVLAHEMSLARASTELNAASASTNIQSRFRYTDSPELLLLDESAPPASFEALVSL